MAALSHMAWLWIRKRCFCLWVDAGPCQGAECGECSIGLDFSHTTMCSGPDPTVNKADMALSLKDLIVQKRRTMSKLAVKFGQFKGS